MLYNSNDIQKIIPHRYPFLLVDCIESISEDGKTIVGKKCVTANEMQFLGHFPEKHVMPGVLIIEALAQTGCVFFFAGINKARFRKQVIPGDVLTMTVTLTKEKGGIYFASIQAKVEDEIAVTGEIMCAVGE